MNVLETLTQEQAQLNSTAAGCCFAPADLDTIKSEKYILVYPYTDPGKPFSQLSPQDITFYFHFNNRTGKPVMNGSKEKTCGANCSGCYFQTLPSYEIDPEVAKKVARDFREAGYDIGLITADSFSDLDLNKIAEAGSAFRYDLTTQNGNAWTAGPQLAEADAFEKLDKGWQSGYGIITISLYNTVLSHPMKGVPKNESIRTAINNIQTWNKAKFPDGGGCRMITTQLVNRTNCDLDLLRKVAQWCLENGINICRFNAFANFLNDEEMRDYELRAEDVRNFWNILAQLQQEFMDTPLRFGVSEDMSAEGIDACIPYFNPTDGWGKFDAEKPYWCRAGYRLFAINGVRNAVNGEVELVIAGCVDNWGKASLGKVVLNEAGKYAPIFEVEKIEALRTAITGGVVSTCWGGIGNPNGQTDTRGFIPSSEDEEVFFNKLIFL